MPSKPRRIKAAPALLLIAILVSGALLTWHTVVSADRDQCAKPITPTSLATVLEKWRITKVLPVL